VLHTGRLHLYPQTLYKAVKAHQGQTSLLQKSVNYSRKKFYSTSPRSLMVSVVRFEPLILGLRVERSTTVLKTLAWISNLQQNSFLS